MLFFQLAKQYNMVIVSPILERDEVHGDTLANTAGACYNVNYDLRMLIPNKVNFYDRFFDNKDELWLIESATDHFWLAP